MSMGSSLKWLLWSGRKIFGLANPGDREYEKFHLNYGNGEEGCSLEWNNGVGVWGHSHYKGLFSRALKCKE